MFQNLSTTDIAAWWGAAIATVVLLWDIFKWKHEGPQLVMRLSQNMKTIDVPDRDGQLWVTVTVTNTGSRPTTLKMVGMEYYKNVFSRFFSKGNFACVFPNASDNFPLPSKLDSGEEWTGFIPQEKPLHEEKNLLEMARAGHAIIWVSLTHKEKGLKVRLKPK